MSATTSAFSGSVRLPDDVLPAFIVANGSQDGGCTVTLLPGGGQFRLKEPESLTKIPSDSIQSCQGLSLGMSGSRGVKGVASTDAHLVEY